MPVIRKMKTLESLIFVRFFVIEAKALDLGKRFTCDVVLLFIFYIFALPMSVWFN